MPSSAQRSRFGDTAPTTARSRFGDTAPPEAVVPASQEVIPPGVPFGAVPSGALANQFGGVENDPRAFARATELADPVLQGLTFGFGDELTAGMIAATSDRTFDEALAEVRERSARIREEQGGAALTAELGGGLATGGTAVALGRNVARNLPNLVRFGLGGAAAGAVSGAGTSEGGVAERAAGATEGAALGAAIGITLPAAGKAAAAALTPLLNRVPGPSRQAIERIRRALERDEMTVENARDELQRLGVNATIADAGGENVRALAQAAQSRVGPARNVGRRVLDERQAGQGERIAATINDTLGRGGEFRLTRDQLIQARRDASRVLYDGAYEIGIPATPALRRLFERPAIRQAYERATTIAANENVRLPNIFDDSGRLLIGEGRAVPTRVIDYIQRGLSDIVEGDRNQITGAIMTEVGRGVNKSRRDLLALTDRENPVFAAARTVYAGDSASIAALNQGRRLGLSLNRRSEEFDPEAIYESLAEMNEAERAFFRQGLARGLMDVVQMTSDTADAVKRLVGNEARRGRLRAAFPDNETFSRFMFDLNRELRFFDTRSAVLSGSPTQPRLAAQEALEGTPVRNPLQGGLVESVGRGTMALVNRAARPSPELAGEVGDILFAQGPNALRALDTIGRSPTISPALERNALRALLEAERQAGAAPNR